MKTDPFFQWVQRHRTIYRTASTVVFILTLMTAGRMMLNPDLPLWLRGSGFGLGIGTAASMIVVWKMWLRLDELNELAEHVARMGGEGREHFVWLMAYQHMATSVARQVNKWLRTHDLRAVPREDMPDEIQVLDRLLEQLRP